MNKNQYLYAVIFAGVSFVAPGQICIAQTPEENIKKLGLNLTDVIKPKSSYLSSVTANNFLYLSGKGPMEKNGRYITGKLGKDMTTVRGYHAAQIVALAQLSEMKAALGDLSRGKRIVKVTGFVNCTEDFTRQSQVIDGFSDMMEEVFGEKGKHARSAVGVISLPFGMPVEIELVVEIE